MKERIKKTIEQAKKSIASWPIWQQEIVKQGEIVSKPEEDLNEVVLKLNERYVSEEMKKKYIFVLFWRIDYGYNSQIFFLDDLLWDSDDDCRETDEYDYVETVFEYCCKEYEKLIKMMHRAI